MPVMIQALRVPINTGLKTHAYETRQGGLQRNFSMALSKLQGKRLQARVVLPTVGLLAVAAEHQCFGAAPEQGPVEPGVAPARENAVVRFERRRVVRAVHLLQRFSEKVS